MKKIKRVSLITFAVALLALAVITIGVIASFDPNDYKPRIAQYFQDTYQRKLIMPGKIKLKLFPRAHLELGEVSLQEKNSEVTFAKIKSARLSVALLPLIDRKLDVGHMNIDGLDLRLTRFKDGSTNIDDLLAGDGRTRTDFDVKSVELTAAALHVVDEASGRNMALDKLQLTTARLANGKPTHIAINADLRLNQPVASAHFNVKSDLVFDLAQKQFTFTQLTADSKGDVAEWRDAVFNVAGAAAYDGAKNSAQLTGISAQGVVRRGAENWTVKILMPEAATQGANGSAKNITADIGLLRNADALNAVLTLSELRLTDAQWQAKNSDLVAILKRGADSLDAKVKIPDAAISKRQWHANDVSATARWSQKTDVADVKLLAANIAGDEKSIRTQAAQWETKGVLGGQPLAVNVVGDVEVIDNNQIVTNKPLKADFTISALGNQLQGTLTSLARIKLAESTYDFTSLAIDMKMFLAHAVSPLTLKASGAINADGARKNVNGNLHGNLNAAKLDGKFGVHNFTAPAYTFDFLLSEFNTAWLASKPVVEKADAKTKPATPEHFAWLKPLDANGTLRIGELIADDKRATNVRLDVKSDKKTP